MDRATNGERPKLALALQGGGAHGAYGWGVLERLLAEDIDIVAVSGASAGALNGAALVAGLANGGVEGALASLERLWTAVSRGSPLQAFDAGFWGGHFWGGPLFEPLLRRSLEMSKLFGRYVAPFVPHVQDMSALRRVVASSIDLDALTRPGVVPLYVSATRVANGTARLFTGADVTLDAIMASACLPDLFAAVEIDGEEYWDGGFSANPALEPLIFDGHGATDMLVVQITPFTNEDIPSSVAGIVGRVSEISFNACLLRDLKALTEVKRYADEASSSSSRMQVLAATDLHLMEAPAELARRGAAGKLDTRASQIEALRVLGRERADAWLADHGDLVGKASTLSDLSDTAAG